MIRVLVVDDEQTARERLRHLLGLIPGVEVAGEAADGEQAIARIAELRPDLVLMDIQMPSCSGLEVVASLPSPRPKIVFCTAFDQYAVDAFELHAVDYLLKPVNRIRLAHAIERVRGSGAAEASNGIDRALQAVRTANLRLLARVGDRYRVIPLSDAIYFSSVDRLTSLHTREREYVVDPTLNELEERLDPACFFRVSRAAIVCLNAVTEVLPLAGGVADVVLANGARLEVSRRRLKDLLRVLSGVPGDS
jgi:two-component system, LytTR family, response regulator